MKRRRISSLSAWGFEVGSCGEEKDGEVEVRSCSDGDKRNEASWSERLNRNAEARAGAAIVLVGVDVEESVVGDDAESDPKPNDADTGEASPRADSQAPATTFGTSNLSKVARSGLTLDSITGLSTVGISTPVLRILRVFFSCTLVSSFKRRFVFRMSGGKSREAVDGDACSCETR